MGIYYTSHTAALTIVNLNIRVSTPCFPGSTQETRVFRGDVVSNRSTVELLAENSKTAREMGCQQGEPRSRWRLVCASGTAVLCLVVVSTCSSPDQTKVRLLTPAVRPEYFALVRMRCAGVCGSGSNSNGTTERG